MKFLFLSLFIASCASAKNPILKEMTIRPGEVRWVEVDLNSKEAQLICRDKVIKFHRDGSKIRALITESYFSDMSTFVCTFKAGKKVLADIIFKVEERKYLSEKLKVDPKRIKLSPKDQLRVDHEQLKLNRIYASSLNKIQFSGAFREPMSSHITSVYGTRRVYNKQKKGQHLGIDFRAAIGDQVPSTNAGKIVFAGDLFYTGHTVIIDHGLDIFSIYGHMSKTTVEVGQFVDKGEVIGLSGNTGRTSGPHLHWGVKVQGQYIDGLVLIEETKKIFEN
jgi:murein DD-endopeptidase MepM/ murein hydrolase activator NlpD